MRPLHQGWLGEGGPGPQELTHRSPAKSKQNCRKFSPRGAWQGLSKPRAAKGGLMRLSARRVPGFLHLGCQWEGSEGHMGLDSPWLDTGRAGSVPCRPRAVKVREAGFLQPLPVPHLVPEAWHTLGRTNPHKPGQLFPNTAFGRPWTWLPSMGRGPCPGPQPRKAAGQARQRGECPPTWATPLKLQRQLPHVSRFS